MAYTYDNSVDPHYVQFNSPFEKRYDKNGKERDDWYYLYCKENGYYCAEPGYGLNGATGIITQVNRRGRKAQHGIE